MDRFGVVGADGSRWFARMLAPLAFFAGATILVLVVQSSLEAGREVAPPPPTTAPAPANARGGETTETGATETRRQQRRRFYRVKAGDTLESIAARFDTTVEELLELNPRIDPLALTPGQRIRIR